MKGVLGIVTAGYIAAGVIAVAVYLPQIGAAWRSRKDPRALSLATWSLWCCTSTVSLLYALMVAEDRLYAGLSLGHTLGCAIVFSIASMERVRVRMIALSARASVWASRIRFAAAGVLHAMLAIRVRTRAMSLGENLLPPRIGEGTGAGS